ncbi:MAG: hypothetical protein LBV47_02390, partial [Bacteroidales bacterium]|nr:hypothetical protein [Bacteroidales bacterium]
MGKRLINIWGEIKKFKWNNSFLLFGVLLLSTAINYTDALAKGCNKIWESTGEVTGKAYYFYGYYSGNEPYKLKYQTEGVSEVWRVKQDIYTDEVNGNKRELLIQKISAEPVNPDKLTDYFKNPNVKETLGPIEVITDCDEIANQINGMDWNSLKSGLNSFNSRLNYAWNINVIDSNGNRHELATGSKGSVTYRYDGKKWTAEISGADREVKEIIEEVINKKLDAFDIAENGRPARTETTTVAPFTTEDGGEFRFGDGLHWYEWGVVLADAGVSIYENATLPETYWKQDDPKYKSYPLHVAPTFAGVADGVIDEITGIAQLVKLGLEITTDKEMAKALWESVKNINLETIKEAATGAVKEKWDKYANSPDYITYHEIGKDGVAIASMLYGGFLVKGKNVTEVVEESGTIIKNAKKIFASVQDMVEKIAGNRRAIRGSIIDLPETRRLAQEYARHTGIADTDFENWFENTFKTYESGTPNFEAHHVIPIET